MEARRNTDLRRANVLDVLHHLRSGTRMSRADLAARTTLSPQALATILNGLLKSRHVVEVEVRGGRRGRGRPALLYEYNAARATMISVYVGLRYCELQYCDAAGTPLLPNEEFSPGWDPVAVADESASRISAALDTLKTPREHCVAAIVVHGTVDSTNGIASSPSMAWRDVPIASMLAERTSIDVTVHEACRAAAIAELHEGAARGARRSVVFNIGPEIAAALIEHGKVVTGSFSLAGQLGGTLAPLDGEVRPLRDLIGSVVATERYSELSGNRVRWMSDVYRLSREGDTIARAMVDRGAEGISFATGWLIAIHDPERLVITGAVGDLDQQARRHLTERIVDRCDPQFLERVTIELSPLGRSAWTRGGIHAAIDRHRALEAATI